MPRGVLDAAGDPAAARSAERSWHRAHRASGDARAPVVGGRHREHRAPERGRLRRERHCFRAVRGGRDHGEVAVHVDTAHGGGDHAAVGEGEGELASPHVMGVRDHEAVAHDDADAPAVAPDPHERRPDRGGDRLDGGFLAHPLLQREVPCNLQETRNSRAGRQPGSMRG
jgi:hypothetical protein